VLLLPAPLARLATWPAARHLVPVSVARCAGPAARPTTLPRRQRCQVFERRHGAPPVPPAPLYSPTHAAWGMAGAAGAPGSSFATPAPIRWAVFAARRWPLCTTHPLPDVW